MGEGRFTGQDLTFWCSITLQTLDIATLGVMPWTEPQQSRQQVEGMDYCPSALLC